MRYSIARPGVRAIRIFHVPNGAASQRSSTVTSAISSMILSMMEIDIIQMCLWHSNERYDRCYAT